MAVTWTLGNMLELFSAVTPLFIGFFLVMVSLFNQNLKGIVYLAGVLIASIVNVFAMTLIASPKEVGHSLTCDIFEPLLGPASGYNSPAMNSMFIAFTIAYLILPMYYNNQMNYFVAAALFCLFGLDVVVQIGKQCTTVAGAFFGALLGFLLGAAWYSVFFGAGYSSLLFFDELQSNGAQCSRPSKQTFKCSVYKGGELIAQNVV